MPQHTKSSATPQFSRLRATARIRQAKPGWAVAFATATIEGGEFSVVILPKMAQARSALQRFGIKESKATRVQNQTSGYAWFEDGKFVLSMKQGSFSNARKAFRGFMDSFSIPRAQIEESQELSDDVVTRNEAQDEDELERLEQEARDQDSAASADDDAPEGEPDATDAATDAPSSEPEPADPEVESPAETVERPMAPALSAERQQAVTKSSQSSAKEVFRALRRVPGLAEINEQETAERMALLLTDRMASLPDDMHDALLETGPVRLSLAMTRDTMLPWLGQAEMPGVLNRHPADVQIGAAEVTQHFMHIASHNLHRHDPQARISRMKLDARVRALMHDGAAAAENAEGLEQLTMTLLPLLANPAMLVRHFVAPKMKQIEDLTPFDMGVMDLPGLLGEALCQVSDCMEAHQNALIAEGGAGIPADHANAFDEMRSGLIERSTALQDLVGDLAALSDRGSAPEPAQIDALLASVQALMGYVNEKFAGSDTCGASYKPTRIRKLYKGALDRFTASVQAG